MYKVAIAEISDERYWGRYFSLYAHTWSVSTINDYTGIIHPDFKPELIGLKVDTNVLSFSVNKLQYLKVSTVSECVINDSSFHYDISNGLLTVHFDNNKVPYQFGEGEIFIGFILGFYSTDSEKEVIINNQQYFPNLKKAPLLGTKKDDIYSSIQTFKNQRISIENSDYTLFPFSISSSQKLGSFVRIWFWEGQDEVITYANSELTFQGVIEKIKEGQEIELDLRDIRKTLNKKTPSIYLDNSLYPNLKKPDKSHILPKVWGKCFDIPCLCLNEDVNKVSGSVDYEFLICDVSKSSIESINEVYINGTAVNVSPSIVETSVGINTSIATFTLASSLFRTDDGKYKNISKVTIDVNGYVDDSLNLIEKHMHIIRQILLEEYAYAFTSSFFDLTTWNTFEGNSNSAYNGGIFLKKPEQVQKIVGKLAGSDLGQFIWNQELKFSWDNDDFLDYSAEIPKEELISLGYSPEFSQDAIQTLSIFRIGIQKNWSTTDKEDEFNWIIDESNKTNALLKYNSTYERDFETLINNLSDAEKYAVRLLNFGGIADVRINITLPWTRKSLKAGEWIKIELGIPNYDLLGWAKCQIQQSFPKVNNWTVQMELKIFEIYPYIYYEGAPACYNGIPLIYGEGVSL